ncbi:MULTISPECIES: invasion associated locus B family protein [unclassified Lentilitoribacter]|jgi:invasion protein IalB|uniref:invasion associated locus B family protein n=1 Tax=unclassified Lentilitoribacter TaxID=2647570 RepID=UPI0013A6A30B|nr:invasion associated locus B family protein [Lentilitoribacter sp. Alg239-R112]
MFKLFNKSIKTATIFVGVITAGVTGTYAQQSQAPIDGWYKECSKQADNDICVVQNIVTAQSGQLITAVGLVDVSGKVNQKLLQVTVPIARFIPPGISLQVDGGKQTKIPYAVCLPDKCIAQIPMTDAVVANFKKGSEAVFTSVNAQRAANPIRISLAGFTQAFDGEALGLAERDEKAKAREDEIRKKLEESRAKLQAAQDAAKKTE